MNRQGHCPATHPILGQCIGYEGHHVPFNWKTWHGVGPTLGGWDPETGRTDLRATPAELAAHLAAQRDLGRITVAEYRAGMAALTDLISATNTNGRT